MSAWSYVSGVGDAPLLGLTTAECVDRAVALWPEREALASPSHDVRWTWAQLAERVDALAAGFVALGLDRGDRIGTWSLNRPEWTLTQLAAAKAGLILVTINPAYRRAELEYALTKVGCAALVTATRFKSSAYVEMLKELAPELARSQPGALRAARLPNLRAVIQLGGPPSPGMVPFDEVLEMGTEADRRRVAEVAATLDFDDPVNIQFTSGTTGAPKGVTLTHHGIINNGYFVGRRMALGPEDRICIPVPLYHCFGMVLGNLAALTHGATMVYPGEGFDALATLTTVEAERCTALYGVPTMFIAELDHPEFARFDVSSLRTGAIGGAPCPIETMRRIVDQLHMYEVTNVYGMTEMSPCSFQTATDDSLHRRVTTVGRVQPYVEAKIVGHDGAILPRGETGELCTRGYSVMLGYWDEPEKTAEAIDAARWMHTGDLATMDEDGYVNIVGRSKEMVIRGGENIYPREIEEFLIGLPEVSDAYVIGVPSERYGEELMAWVSPSNGSRATGEELAAACRGRIATYKIPRYWKLVDAFPMTVSGKVQKFRMRERSIEDLGLGRAAAIETA
jgi:fatty-acyl-CoA synthase